MTNPKYTEYQPGIFAANVDIKQVSGDMILISGTVTTSVSGNIVEISGQIVQISGKVDVATRSGDYVVISGTISITPLTTLRAGYVQTGSLSGGTQLSSGPISFVKVENISGNDSMWTGPLGVASGAGYLLLANNVDDIYVNDLQTVYVYAQTSGQFVSFRSEG